MELLPTPFLGQLPFKINDITDQTARDALVLKLAETCNDSADFKRALMVLEFTYNNNQTSSLSPQGRRAVINKLKERNFTYFLMENNYLKLSGQQKLI